MINVLELESDRVTKKIPVTKKNNSPTELVWPLEALISLICIKTIDNIANKCIHILMKTKQLQL